MVRLRGWMWTQLHNKCLKIINVVFLELKALLLTLRKVHNLDRASLVSLSGFTFKEQQSRSNLLSALCTSHTWFRLHRLLAPIAMTSLFLFSAACEKFLYWQNKNQICNIATCSRGNFCTELLYGKKTEWWPQHPGNGQGGDVSMKKKSWKGGSQERAKANYLSTRQLCLNSISRLSDPLRVIKVFIERCLRRYVPAPQEPRCALSEREKRRGGTRNQRGG